MDSKKGWRDVPGNRIFGVLVAYSPDVSDVRIREFKKERL